jgi:hypothetical protein
MGRWARTGEEVSGSAQEIIATVFVALMISESAAPALASPHPPTNGGNGAGQSVSAPGRLASVRLRVRARRFTWATESIIW